MAESKGHAEHIKAREEGGEVKIDRPIKIVFMGAGSAFFPPLFTDILHLPGAECGEMCLVDIDKERLALNEKLGKKLIELSGKKGWKIKCTTDRREVMAGANYIVNCIEVSGTACVRFDNDIPAKYGINQCIGDTIGPGGLFKALRTVPVFLDVLADAEELCPGAQVLNYTNPMSIMCYSAAISSTIPVIGLCHSVQGTSKKLAEYAGVPYEEMQFRCGGVNHLAWFTELTHKGKDLYPVLFEKTDEEGSEIWEKDPVRFDMMRHFGYFITESSGHLSEYLPYYRKRPELVKRYCRDKYLGQTSFYADNWPQWRKDADAKRQRIIAGQEEIEFKRSHEYASDIILSIETNKPCVIYGSMPNTALIENLPMDGVVEVACLVDRNGITPTHFGPLPPQCAAICASQMYMYEMAAIACVERCKEAAIHALMLDPLTAAVCSPAEIKQMAMELFDAEKDFLPGF